MQNKVFGNAKDFYRVRIIVINEETPQDFEWRDDILYASKGDINGNTKRAYLVQIVTLDEGKAVFAQIFEKKREANQNLRKMEEDLDDLTKMEFDKKYSIQ